MNEMLQKLQEPLTADQIEFRVSEIRSNNGGVWASILAYKDARCDMKRLDEATDGLWQNEYKRDSNGVLQCGIGIKIEDEWIWKWSNGVQSNFEKAKGEYSDAFKRAGFMWGIGRELYDYPTMAAKLNKKEYKITGKDKWGNDQVKASWYLKPSEWMWEVQHDNGIAVKAVDTDGKTIRVNA